MPSVKSNSYFSPAIVVKIIENVLNDDYKFNLYIKKLKIKFDDFILKDNNKNIKNIYNIDLIIN